MGRIISLSSILVMSLLFIYTPYLRGLFFDTDMYVTEVIIASLFIINAIWILFKNPNKTRSLYMLVFLLPLMHLFSLTVAQTPNGALDNLFRWLAYSSMFMVLIWAKQSVDFKKVEQTLSFVFQATGVWIAFYAVFGLWGWVEFRDIVLAGRMSGTFQYANTFATIISAFWLYALVFLTKRDLPIWAYAAFSLPLVAYGVGFFHSYSRGSMLVFPIAWLLGLLLLKGKEQVTFVLCSIFSVIASFFVFRQITIQSELKIENPGVASFFIATVVVMALIVGMQYLFKRKAFLNQFGTGPYVRFILPGIVIIAGIFLVLDIKNQGLVFQQLPATLQEKISDINTETTSLLGRTNVYEDAFKISKESPIFGVGGEGWKILYPQYQELPYLNNEIHNGYLEVLLSTGWLGLIVFLAVFAFLFTSIVRRVSHESGKQNQTLAKATMPALSMLFLHGMIDFDFSFGTVWFIVFLLFALGVPAEEITSRKLERFALGTVSTRVVLSIAVIFVLVFNIYALRFNLADAAVSQINGEKTIDEAQPVMEKAVRLNPFDTSFQLNLANVYTVRFQNEQEEEWKAKAIEHLQKAESIEPNNSMVLFGVGNGYLELNDWEAAIQYFEKALKLDPFNVQIISNNIRVQSQVAAQFAEKKDKEKTLLLANKAIESYDDYVKRVQPFITQAIPDKRQLELPNSTYFYVGQANLMLGKYPEGIEHLKKVTGAKTTVNAQALLVAAYEALGQNEQASAITKELLSKHADFAQRVVVFRALLSK